MKVTLISRTPDAERVLVLSKNTRLDMTSDRIAEVWAMPEDEVQKELAYMAETIPSSWEFVDYIFLIEGVSRAYTHQQVRTRAGSYAQQTMRVSNMAEFDYIFTERNREDARAMKRIVAIVNGIKDAYNDLIALGQPPEDARGILPTNISTNIMVKFNLRTMAELAASRSGGRTQGEYRAVVNGMIDAVLAAHPWAEKFLFSTVGRDYFAELERAIADEFRDDILKRGKFLKIVDRMRKERT